MPTSFDQLDAQAFYASESLRGPKPTRRPLNVPAPAWIHIMAQRKMGVLLGGMEKNQGGRPEMGLTGHVAGWIIAVVQGRSLAAGNWPSTFVALPSDHGNIPEQLRMGCSING